MDTPNIIYTRNGEVTSMEGPAAYDLLKLAALEESLKLEINGIMLSKTVTALKVAQQTTGDNSRSREKQLALVTKMREDAKSKCTYVEIQE